MSHVWSRVWWDRARNGWAASRGYSTAFDGSIAIGRARRDFGARCFYGPNAERKAARDRTTDWGPMRLASLEPTPGTGSATRG
jgi:hypothetical protein